MPILTIELPEEIAAHIDALPSQDRAELDHKLRELTVAFATARNTPEQNRVPAPAKPSPTFANHKPGDPFPDLLDLPAIHIAAIAEGIADEEAGRVYDGDAVFAEMRERFVWQKK